MEKCLFFDKWNCFKDSVLKSLDVKFHGTYLDENIKVGHPDWIKVCEICQIMGLRTDIYKSRK